MKKVRTYYDLPAGTRSDIAGQLAAQVERLRRRLESVRHTFAVLSGKGGVGKSLVTSSLGISLAQHGKRVVVVDADLGGANLHTCLGLSMPARTLSDFIARRVESIEDVGAFRTEQRVVFAADGQPRSVSAAFMPP